MMKVSFSLLTVVFWTALQLLLANTHAFVLLPQSQTKIRQQQLSLSSTAQNDTATDSLTATILEGLVEAGGSAEEWTQSAEFVANLLKVDYDEGEQILAVATRWKTWATSGEMARKYVTPTLPKVQDLQASLEWLQQEPLQLETNQIQEFVKQHPALYLFQTQDSYRKAISAAPRKYRDAKVFRGLILQDPTVLQCHYNCDNECAAECGSCWVTYANRL